MVFATPPGCSPQPRERRPTASNCHKGAPVGGARPAHRVSSVEANCTWSGRWPGQVTGSFSLPCLHSLGFLGTQEAKVMCQPQRVCSGERDGPGSEHNSGFTSHSVLKKIFF